MVHVIVDPGCNWNGDFSLLKELARECREAGADGFKPQLWATYTLYQPANPHFEIQRRCELTFNQAKDIFEYGREIGIEVFFSAFDVERVEWCERIGVKRYKIASRTAALKDGNSIEVLEAVAKTGKPVIVSTGYGYDAKLLLSLFKIEKIKLLFCVSQYPAEDRDIRLLRFTGRFYDGFSDHSLGITASIAAVARGVQIIEKHLRLPESTGPDAGFSITTDELRELVRHIRRIEVMLR